jgi:S1-C subfamily serine protease
MVWSFVWVFVLGFGGLSRFAPGYLVKSHAASAIGAFEETLEQIYIEVNPSVVHIRVVQEQEVIFPVLPEIPGLPFGPPESSGPRTFFRQGSGSGFVWDAQGHIVTNNHVVADADRISVTLHDGTTVTGEVVGTDPDADLAVIKVELPSQRLRPVQLTDSTQVKVGQLAVALGNPFGLQSTMTVGFVSALGRLLPIGSDDEEEPAYTIPDIIQTDAAINPGNSGGVLVDSHSRVIGVTSAIISPVGASVGIGFAIPAVIVQKVVPVLIRAGHYEHPWLGVSGYPFTPELARPMGLPAEQRGALVVDVVPGSPADKAGTHGSDRQVSLDGSWVRIGGDVIVTIDRQPVRSFDDVVTYLARSAEVGQSVTLDVLRQQKIVQVVVKLTARPQPVERERREETDEVGRVWLGIQGLTVSPEVAQAMQFSEDQRGVLVEQVMHKSPADHAGIRGGYKPMIIQGERVLVGGDVLVAVDEQPLTQMDDLRAFIQQAQPGQKITVSLLRHGKPMRVVVTLTAPPAGKP